MSHINPVLDTVLYSAQNHEIIKMVLVWSFKTDKLQTEKVCFGLSYLFWLTSRNFFRGAKSIVMLIFQLFSDQISGRGKSLWGATCLRGAPPMPPIVEEGRLFSEPRSLTVRADSHVAGDQIRLSRMINCLTFIKKNDSLLVFTIFFV